MNALNGGDLCVNHDPSLILTRKEWRQRGGRNSRKQYEDLNVSSPRSVPEALELLSQTMAGVAQGRIDPRVGDVVASLVREYRQLFELQNLQQKVSELEHATN
jgi:hypothetical protein